MRIDNRTYTEGQRGEIIENAAVSTGYLDTIGFGLTGGRDFTDADRRGAPLVAMVNETMASRYWPNESALGHTFTIVATKNVYTVVGVVADHKRHGVLEAPSPFVLFAAAQRPTRYNYLVARTAGSADELLTSIRRELVAMEPQLVFVGSGTMAGNLEASLLPARVGALLATGLGALGTLLAAIGLYGVIAFSVSRRTREIGVRMALGAKPDGVLKLIMRQGLVLAALGVVVGGLLAAAAGQAISALLFGITPFDPVAWGLAIVVLFLAAGLANLIPANRAMRIDPLQALRME
jgi:ABC-type antimicrobial peptide transport system permease subunit